MSAKKKDHATAGGERVAIRQLPTGVPGLDEILGGGLPEYSFNIIAGAPGSGKTTLAHQIMFANATPERPALYFTVLGEPAIKMLRYQQQFTFLRPGEDGWRDPLRQPQPDWCWTKTWKPCWTPSSGRSRHPTRGLVVVDSFRTVVRKVQAAHQRGGAAGIRPAPGTASDQLAGDHVSDRRICRGRAARQSGIHRRRRADLAYAERRAQLDRAQDAGHEAARPGIGAGPAYLPHHQGRPADASRAPLALASNPPQARENSVCPLALSIWTR